MRKYGSLIAVGYKDRSSDSISLTSCCPTKINVSIWIYKLCFIALLRRSVSMYTEEQKNEKFEEVCLRSGSATIKWDDNGKK